MIDILWIDMLLIAVLVLSVLLSLYRGFVKEVLSLLSWIAAFLMAKSFADPLAQLLDSWISSPTVRHGLAFGLLFLPTLLLAGLLSTGVVRIIKASPLTLTDRALGVIFGLTRGLLIITVVVFLFKFTPLPEERWWQESQFLPHFELLALWVVEQLPSLTADHDWTFWSS